MKVFICILAITVSASAGILGGIPANLYSGATVLSNQLGPDCFTTYGHSGGHHSHGHEVVKLLPAAGYTGVEHFGGLTHYSGGLQHVKVLQQQQQAPVFPVAHLTSGAPLSAYTSAGHYGTTFQLVQPESHLNVFAKSLQPVRYVQQSPVFETVKFIQEPSPVVQVPEVKTIKIIQGRNLQGSTVENVKTIRLVQEPAPVHPVQEVKTIRLIHEKTHAKPIRETKTLRIVEEQSEHEDNERHESPFIPSQQQQQQHHHQQHVESATFPTPHSPHHISTELSAPPEGSDVNQNDFRFTNQAEQGYGYNAPNNRHFRV